MQARFRWPSTQRQSPDHLSRLLSHGALRPSGSPAAWRGRAPWVLSRALYRLRVFDLAAIGGADRRAALRAQLLAWAPFEDNEYRVAMSADGAVAAAWDRTRVAGLLAAAGAEPQAAVLPELWVREPMSGSGLRLLDALEGIEAQCWQSGTLRASRWWPGVADPDEARAWLRSLGSSGADRNTLPSLNRVPWSSRPAYDVLSVDDLLSSTSRFERVAIGVASVVLVAFTAAQVRQMAVAHRGLDDVQHRIEQARTDAGPLLAARDRALALAAEANALSRQLTAVAPLEVLQHIADMLPPDGVILRELDLRGSALRIALELAPQVSRSNVVRDLQAGGWFKRIAEAPDSASRGWTQFDIELAGIKPAPGAVVARPVASAAAAPPAAPAAAFPVPPFPAPAPPAPPPATAAAAVPEAAPSADAEAAPTRRVRRPRAEPR